MSQPAFLVTMDTEGDDLWSRPRQVTTENARYLPRFQALCERHGFLPTWLTNYEMARCPVFVAFGRELLRRGAGEVGMHLHAWNSPPLVSLTADDLAHQPYLVEYPDELMHEKVAHLTRLLEDTFGTKMTSHRAGRWAIDPRYARILGDRGYEVDCSVTPTISWRHAKGDPSGGGGADYTAAPCWPYLMSADDVMRPGQGRLLQVPMTTRLAYPRLSRLIPSAAAHVRPLRRVRKARLWFRPKPGNRSEMLALAERAKRERWPYVQFMLHSSELMPGGSPTFQTAGDVERMYANLEDLFARMERDFVGMTLTAFARMWMSERDMSPARLTGP